MGGRRREEVEEVVSDLTDRISANLVVKKKRFFFVGWSKEEDFFFLALRSPEEGE